jgi:Cytochrome P450
MPFRPASGSCYAYFPFGGGPHQCIGAAFGKMATQLCLATLAQRLRFDSDEESIALEALITLRPRHGLRVTIGRPSPVIPPRYQPLHPRPPGADRQQDADRDQPGRNRRCARRRRVGSDRQDRRTGNVVFDPMRRQFWITVVTANPPDQLVAVDPPTAKVTTTIDLPGCDGAHGLRLHPDGQTDRVRHPATGHRPDRPRSARRQLPLGGGRSGHPPRVLPADGRTGGDARPSHHASHGRLTPESDASY